MVRDWVRLRGKVPHCSINLVTLHNLVANVQAPVSKNMLKYIILQQYKFSCKNIGIVHNFFDLPWIGRVCFRWGIKVPYLDELPLHWEIQVATAGFGCLFFLSFRWEEVVVEGFLHDDACRKWQWLMAIALEGLVFIVGLMLNLVIMRLFSQEMFLYYLLFVSISGD